MFTGANYPNLLVGLEISDDAAVYKISDDLAIVQTLDFFTPIVDDPYTYGAIAAANAMSDVYAMGGDVLLALNIACFPSHVPAAVLAQILRGGADKVKEAGGVVAGGHTVDDPEPKFGLSVMGKVHPKHIGVKSGVRSGDYLLLTKPLGTGIITTAAKSDVAQPEHLNAAIQSMLRLNSIGARLVPEFNLSGVTDITGFALLGHAYEMAEHSGVCLRIHSANVPLLPGARDYADQWLFPGGSKRNQEYYDQWVQVEAGIPDELVALLYTPETSGGLLVAVPPLKLAEVETYMHAAGESYWVIGHAEPGTGISLD
jgi:selenide, water dikinase